MKAILILLVSPLALATAGCVKSPPAAAHGQRQPVQASTPSRGQDAGATARNVLAIARLGLTIEVPAGATTSDGAGGGVTIQAADLVLTVKEPDQFAPATLDAAQSEAGMYDPRNIRTETLADGWALTFENTGAMGSSYWVQVRREIGGTAYLCETTAAQVAQQANALEACKSLAR